MSIDVQHKYSYQRFSCCLTYFWPQLWEKITTKQGVKVFFGSFYYNACCTMSQQRKTFPSLRCMFSRASHHEATFSKSLAWVFFWCLFMFRNDLKNLKNLGRSFHDWKMVLKITNPHYRVKIQNCRRPMVWPIKTCARRALSQRKKLELNRTYQLREKSKKPPERWVSFYCPLFVCVGFWSCSNFTNLTDGWNMGKQMMNTWIKYGKARWWSEQRKKQQLVMATVIIYNLYPHDSHADWIEWWRKSLWCRPIHKVKRDEQGFWGFAQDQVRHKH